MILKALGLRQINLHNLLTKTEDNQVIFKMIIKERLDGKILTHKTKTFTQMF